MDWHETLEDHKNICVLQNIHIMLLKFLKKKNIIKDFFK